MCVIAAVSVVFPWSTWPIVPTFTCGLVRSNLPLAIANRPVYVALLTTSLLRVVHRDPLLFFVFAGVLVDDRFGDVLGRFGVVLEFHRVRGAALRERAQRRRVTEHLGERDLCLHGFAA